MFKLIKKIFSKQNQMSINDEKLRSDILSKTMQFEPSQSPITTGSVSFDSSQSSETMSETEKFYINVPYSEKDKAKELGAKWDPIKKLWYIPKGLHHVHFEKWIYLNNEKNKDSNIRSVGFFIAESLESCWKCRQDTPVFAFLLPENHQTKEYEDEDDEENNNIIWMDGNYKSIVSFVSFVNKKCMEIIHAFSSYYYFDFSKHSASSYYMNHCKNCNSKLGDFYMHSEPKGAFQPVTSEAAESIKLYWFNDIFEANAQTYSVGVNYFDYMKNTNTNSN